MILAAFWFGSAALLAFIIAPALGDAGAAGNAAMSAMAKRGLVVWMAVLGGLTALTGIVLFWHFTAGFNPEISRSHAGMAFGTGGAAGLISVILGGAVIGKAAKKMVEAIDKAAATPEGPARAALLQEAHVQHQKLVSSSKIGMLLMLIAFVCMAVGHYV